VTYWFEHWNFSTAIVMVRFDVLLFHFHYRFLLFFLFDRRLVGRSRRFGVQLEVR
jgi:hypothetical protein